MFLHLDALVAHQTMYTSSIVPLQKTNAYLYGQNDHVNQLWLVGPPKYYYQAKMKNAGSREGYHPSANLKRRKSIGQRALDSAKVIYIIFLFLR
jgi:hypothetical protein